VPTVAAKSYSPTQADVAVRIEQAPPTDAPPALVPPLLRQQTKPGSYEFTATLFDPIRRGRCTAQPVTTEHASWGGLRHEQAADLELARDDQRAELAPFERPVAAVFDDVLATGPERLSNMRDRTTANRTENSTRFTSFASSALASGDLTAGFGSALAPPSSSGSGGAFSGGGGGGGGGGGVW